MIKLTPFSNLTLAQRLQAWRLYEDSFPHYERRSWECQLLTLSDNAFRAEVVVDSQSQMAVALIFYWVDDSMVYIEHIAVSEELRGQGIGAKLIAQLIGCFPDSLIVLEIDPPTDTISVRRLGFYLRLGFLETGISFIHPSFATPATPHQLDLLSYPRKIEQSEFEGFQYFLKNRVLIYRD